MGREAQQAQVDKRRHARRVTRQGRSLRSHLITSKLHMRYCQAVSRVLTFWDELPQGPTGLGDIDFFTGLWLEHLFAEGFPKGHASDGLAALQHFLPEACGRLRNSWRLLKTWQRMEPPLRALPLSPLMVLGFAGACVRLGCLPAAAAMLVGFNTMLRPGEMYQLKVSDITWAGNQAALALHKTKTGQRKGATELVVCRSHLANFWLLRASQTRPPNSVLLDGPPEKFRALFFYLLAHFSIAGYFTMYSFRRGGATWDFLTSHSMEQTLLRGQWQSSSTARIYLQDAAATLAHLQLTPQQQSELRSMSQYLTCGASGR